MNLVPVGLNKSSDKLEKEIIRREVYDELVKKVNAIQTTDIGNLVKKLTIISKTNEVGIAYLIMVKKQINFYSRLYYKTLLLKYKIKT